MNTNKLGIGILGLGTRGVYFGGKVLGGHPDCEVVSICDLRDERIAAARNVLGDVPATKSVEEFLQAPGLDAVIVATPDKYHFEHASRVLRARKHLYLEKPMAQTVEHCDALIEIGKKAGVVFMVGLELRYCSLAQDMKALIDQGEIGDIKLGYVVDNVSVGGNYYFHGERRRKEYVKSLMLEKGTHSLDLTNWFLSSWPTRVYCSSGLDVFGGNAPNDKRCSECEIQDTCPYFIDKSKFELDYAVLQNPRELCVYAEEVDVHDNGIVTIDYASGARISYVECHFTPEYSREFTFIGTGGKMYGFFNNDQEFEITVRKRHSRKKDVYYPERKKGGHGGGDPAIVDSFIQRARAGRPGMPGVRGARDSAAIAIAAFESDERGVPVTVPQSDVPEET